MSYATIPLPCVRKTQVVDANLATAHVKGMLSELATMKFTDFEDYQCAVNEMTTYIEDNADTRSEESEMRVDASIALAVFLNNASFIFSDDEVSQLIEEYEQEKVNITKHGEHGWQPVLEFGFNTFFVADTYQ